MRRVPRIPGLTTTSLITGALLAVPGTLGLVLGHQITSARRGGFLPRPDYQVDVTVSPPWAEGATLQVAFLGDSLVEGVGAPRAAVRVQRVVDQLLHRAVLDAGAQTRRE